MPSPTRAYPTAPWLPLLDAQTKPGRRVHVVMFPPQTARPVALCGSGRVTPHLAGGARCGMCVAILAAHGLWPL